jgi:PAS domain S-box-containing protein
MRTSYLDQPKYRLAVLGIAALPVLYLISRYNYNFFHSLVDGASIVIAVSVFIIIWNTRHLLENDYLLYVGISFLFFAFLDLLHVLGNKNMGVFPAYGNLGPALYIASRYVISISLLIAPLFVKRKLNTSIVFTVYSLVTAFILLSIFYWHVFPVCIIEGVGLTPFKVISDYIVCLILLGAIGLLVVNREPFDSRVFRLIIASISLSIATGVAFTLYADPFGITNAAGHFLQIASFFIVYLAIIETSLKKPQDILYRKLTQKEKELAENLKRLDHVNAGLKQEIIERKRAEEALRVSEQRWSVTLSSIGDAVIATDTSGRITFLNQVAEMLTGWPMAEADGKRVQEVFRIVNEYSRAVVDDPVRKVLTSGLVVGLANHTVLLRKDGGEVPIDDSAAPIRDEAGQILGVVLIFREITERRRAENALRESETKYRTLFENITEEVHFWKVVRDESGRIKTWRLVDVNPPTLKTWGRKTVDEIRGNTTDEIFGPGATEHYLPVVQKIITEGIPNTFEDYFPHLDKYFRFTSVPIGDHFITTGADITDIKKAEKALLQLNETLEQRVSERTELAQARSRQLQALAVELIAAEEQERRRIAHLLHDDLQQMLAAAKMQLQSVADNLPNEMLLQNVCQILDDSIAKTRRLSHELSPAVLHHSGLVAGLKWLSGQMKEQFGLIIDIKKNTDMVLESTPLKVFLFRAVQELLFNIVKHAGVKSACIDLSTSNGFFAISVSDIGQGFDPEKMDKGGSRIGLGLLTIQERADYIGANLTIDSAPGKGSRFTLKVPLRMVDLDEALHLNCAIPPKNSPPALLTNPIVAGSTRVLFVDDHQVMRQGLIKLIAGQPDVQVIGEAANGQEAIEQARYLKPDVVVMDINMPQINGIEATRIIKSEMPGIRVIGLSMHEDDNNRQIMLEAGAESFVSKTASPAELLMAIYGGTKQN